MIPRHACRSVWSVLTDATSELKQRRKPEERRLRSDRRSRRRASWSCAAVSDHALNARRASRDCSDAHARRIDAVRSRIPAHVSTHDDSKRRSAGARKPLAARSINRRPSTISSHVDHAARARPPPHSRAATPSRRLASRLRSRACDHAPRRVCVWRFRWQFGRLPLHLAAQCKASEAVVKALLAAFPEGAKAKANGGYTPLDMAMKENASEVVQQLLRAAM